MNKKVLTLCVSALLAGAWTTLNAKVVSVQPSIGGTYLIGTGVGDNAVTNLLKPGDFSSDATGSVNSNSEAWILEDAGEGTFYLKIAEGTYAGQYLAFYDESNGGTNGDFLTYSAETEDAIKFKFVENGGIVVAEEIGGTNGKFLVNDPFVLTTSDRAKVDFSNRTDPATPLTFVVYGADEIYNGMPGLDKVVTNAGVVDPLTLTSDVTVKAPLNIKADGIYLSVTKDTNGDYAIEKDVDKQVKALNASNSLAASWEWQNGYLVSTAALRAAEPEKVYLVYGEDGFNVVSTSATTSVIPTGATNFAENANAKAALDEVRVSATSLEGDDKIPVLTGGIIVNNPLTGDAEKIAGIPSSSDYVIVGLEDANGSSYYLVDDGEGNVSLSNRFEANNYKQYLWKVGNGTSGNVVNYTFTNLASGKAWTNGYSTFVGAGDVSGLTLTLQNGNIGIDGSGDGATINYNATTKAIVSFYEAPMAAKKHSELDAIYDPGFAMTIKISKNGTETIEGVENFNGTLYPEKVGNDTDPITVRLWDNKEFAGGHNARILVLDKTTKVGSDDNSNVEGSFKWITPTELKNHPEKYETNFQFLYSLTSGKTDGADIEWVKIGGSYLYILSTGNNRYQLTSIKYIEDRTAQPYIVLQSNNIVDVKTLLNKYLTFSFVNNQELEDEKNEAYKLNSVLSVAYRATNGVWKNKADYVDASSVLLTSPEAQWVVTSVSGGTFTLENREADVKIEGVTLRKNTDGTYTINSANNEIKTDVVRMNATNIVGTRHMDGYMDAKPGELRNQVFHIGQYHYETGNSTAFWAENHQANRSHQLGVTTTEENAVDWSLSLEMQCDMNNDRIETADADTIYVVKHLAALNNNGGIDNEEQADTLAILQYKFQNKGNLEYVIYNDNNNMDYYQCQPDYSWDGFWETQPQKDAEPAVRFALKLKPDSTYNVIPVAKYYDDEAEKAVVKLSTQKVYVANSEQWGSVKHMNLYAEDNNSLMQVLPVDRPEYRQIEMVWGDTIKLWRNENEAMVVYEKKDAKSVVEGETLSFLNIDNDTQFDMNPAIFADTAYINRWDADGIKNTCYQYLLAVNPTNVSEYYCPLTPEHNTTAWREANGGPCPDAEKSAYVEGRFLVNLIDTANVYGLTHLHNNPYINRTEEGNDCAKLAFVPGKHMGDSLVIYRDEAMTDVIDTLYLGTEDFNIAKFAFKYVDVEAGSFKIQTQWKEYLATETGYADVNDFEEAYEEAAQDRNESIISNEGYLRYVNGCLVVDKSFQKGDVFNMTERYTAQAPTANEEISAENAAVSVVATDGAVVIKGAEGKNVVIATILGKVVANETINSDNETIAVPAGIAVVSVDGESFKVVVK